MSRIFISHNSADNLLTEDIRDRLEKAGHHCIYVDFDPEQGIAAGQDWERDLYRELRACRALIILCSKASMNSLWCFAELTHAKSMGKPVIPIKIEACQIHSILSRHQCIDWTADAEQAWARLQRGLLQAGIDPRDSFSWDGTRPPYPGLMSFQEEDAAIFFGRQAEIQSGLEALNRQHQMGDPRSLMVFGPSGSGKSSLVRAGLVPRLKSNEEQWLILDVIRPRGQPLRELAWTLGRAFQRYDVERGVEELQQHLQDGDAQTLCELVESLRLAANRRDASVLLVIDQAEELISQVSADSTSEPHFLGLVLGAIESDRCALQLVWTLRSDFISAFQGHALLRKLKSTDLSVGLMNAGDIAQVIERPAALAGVELESGLTQKIISDMQGDDALPLLAFSLRELYERYHQDGLLELREYDELGGLTGSIARSAERVYLDAALSREQQAALRRAFLSMVRIGESGSYVRRVISRDSMPDSVQEILEAFVRARLLVAGAEDEQQTLEVAHEALFRAWRRLSLWLQEDQEFLHWLGKLELAVQEWEGEADKENLLRGKALLDAEYHLKAHPSWSPGEKPMRFITASRRRARRQRRGRFLLIAAVMLALAGAALWNMRQVNKLTSANTRAATAILDAQKAAERANEATIKAENAAGIASQEAERARRNLYNARTVLADVVLREDPARARFELEDIARFPVADREITWGYLHHVARKGPPKAIELDSLGRDAPFQQSVAVSPDGTRVAGLQDDHLVIWRINDLAQLQSQELDDRIYPDQIAWTADGIVILEDGKARFFNPDSLVHETDIELTGKAIQTVLFTRDGRRMFAHLGSSESGCELLIYDMQRRENEAFLDCEAEQVDKSLGLLRLSPDERWLVMGYTDLDRTSIIQVYDLELNERVLTLPDGYALALALSNDPDNLKLAWGARDGRIKINRIPSGESLPDLVGHTALAGSISWSPDDTLLVATDFDQETRLWDVEEAKTLASLQVEDRSDFNVVSFSPDGQTLILLGEETIHFWDARNGSLRSESKLELDDTQWLKFLPDESRILVGAPDLFYVLAVDPGWQYQSLSGHRDPVDKLFFPAIDHTLVSKAVDDTIRLWDTHSGSIKETLVGDNEKSIFHHGFLWGSGERHSALASFDPAGRRIAWSTANGSVHLSDVESGKTLPYRIVPQTITEEGERPGVLSLTFSPGSERLFTLWEEGEFQQLDLSSGELTNLPAPEMAETIIELFPESGTGYLLFRESWQPDHRWIVEVPGSGQPAFELPVSSPKSMPAVSDDGKLLAEMISTEGIVKIRELPGGNTIRALSVGLYLDRIFGFSSDSSLLATQSKTPDSTGPLLQIWKWRAGEPCASLTLDQDASAAAISRDNLLLAYSEKEQILLRPLEDCASALPTTP